MSTPHVVVVGAGLSGLAAALGLRERGLRVSLLEAEAAAGGRAGVRDGAAPVHVLDPEARALSALARGAGGEDALLPLRPLADARCRDGRIEALPAWRSREAPRLLQRLGFARLERVEGRFRALLRRASSEEAARLDDRSIAELAALYLPRSALAAWVEPLAALWGLGDPARASRVALLRLHGAGALGAALPRQGLGALAAAVAARFEVRLGCAAERVEAAGAGLRVQLAEGAALEADAVVLAVPARVARELAAPLLTPPEHEILGASRAAPAIALRAELEAGLGPTPTRVAVAGQDGSPLAWLLLEPGPSQRLREGRAAVHLVATPAWSAAHLEAPDDALSKELLAALAQLQPGAAAAVASARVARCAEAFPLFPVGRYRELARLRRVEADRRSLGRRLYLAGDWLAGPTAEDAAASGARAAAEAAADLFGAGRGVS
jgi:oxygen-dependent protoporphyrinogen oxidase